MTITAEALRNNLTYNPETGLWVWNIRIGRGRNAMKQGSPAGYRDTDGYVRITPDGCKKYYAHRLAFLYMLGRWPEGFVDHVNRYRDDNRWCNLREVSARDNTWNTSRSEGVPCIEDLGGSFRVKVSKNYSSLEEAIEARDRALAALDMCVSS